MHDDEWRQIAILQQQLQGLPEGLRDRRLTAVYALRGGWQWHAALVAPRSSTPPILPMMQKKLKTIAMYGVILAAGLGSGYALSLLPGLFKSNYTEGNYAAYFPNPQAKVVLYGTDWCGYCAKTRAYFKENKIDFVDLDIEKSPEAKKAHAELGGGGVPVVLIGNRKIQGFNAGALEAALKKI